MRKENRIDMLNELRNEIDRIDGQLLELLAARMKVSRQIGEYKRTQQMAVVQNDRYNTLLADRMEQGKPLGLKPDFVKAIMDVIHTESVRVQQPA